MTRLDPARSKVLIYGSGSSPEAYVAEDEHARGVHDSGRDCRHRGETITGAAHRLGQPRQRVARDLNQGTLGGRLREPGGHVLELGDGVRDERTRGARRASRGRAHATDLAGGPDSPRARKPTVQKYFPRSMTTLGSDVSGLPDERRK